MAPSTQIADRLLETGLISEGQHRAAIQYFHNFGGFIEDALIESNAIEEEELIKWLAGIHRTRFVSTAKLKKADIGQKILEKIPMDFAVKHMVFPILFDDMSRTLSVVTHAPNDPAIERDIARFSGALKVRSFVARPAAVKAAIAKFYKGDIHAFANVDKDGIAAFQSMMDVYERNLLDEGTMVAAVADSAGLASRERTLDADDLQRSYDGATRMGQADTGMTLEMVRVFMSLLESSRENLSGHSVLTANFAEKLCNKLGLSQSDVAAITLGALLHDIGKGDPYHLTAFNVAEWEGHREAAMQRFETPVRLFESAKLPLETVNTVRRMYERFDGSGFPDGMKRNEIPRGARILAIADTFADLTSNPRNPYRRLLTTQEATEVLRKYKTRIFDDNLVDLFAFVVSGDDIKRKLLTGAQSILVLDSDAEQCAILEMQFTARGFKVHTARRADDAIKFLLETPVSMVLSEVDLEPFDGFELKSRLNKQAKTKDVPFFFFTSRTNAEDVARGFQLSAQDYLVKPSSIEVVATKIQNFLERAKPAAVSGGVAGSLKEMSIPDLVQLLANGRRTGQIKLSFGKYSGEIHIVHGEIYNALFHNLRGEEAFFAMLKMRDGNFAINPDFHADTKVIQGTAEALLLEGMRRVDEENR